MGHRIRELCPGVNEVAPVGPLSFRWRKTRRLSGSVKGIRVRVAVKGGKGSGVAMAESFGHEKLISQPSERLRPMRDTLTRTLNRPLHRHPYSDTLNRASSPRGRWAVDATTP